MKNTIKEPLISIIVPVYNVERYLPACLDSILAQSKSDWECILIDDGSTDNSGKIREEYAAKDSRFRVIHQPNSGPAVARNAGLDNMRGQYVVFIDADDAIAYDYLSALHLLLTGKFCDQDNIGDVDISALGYLRFSGDKIPKGIVTEQYPCHTRRPEEAVEEMLYQTTDFIHPSPWGKMFKARLFDGLRFTPGIIYEDLDLMYRVFLKAKGIKARRYKGYFYRENPKSLTSVPSPQRMDAVTVCEGIVRYMKKRYPGLVAAAEDRLLSASFNMLGLMAAYPGILDEHKERCQRHVEELSPRSFHNKKVRRKNKLGIILYRFRPLFNLIAAQVYR